MTWLETTAMPSDDFHFFPLLFTSFYFVLMPFRVQSRAHPDIEIYWGFDKYENEELLKHFWEGDVWFHVDKHSSAHVYVRIGDKWSIDAIPETLIYEAA